jgi:hypothetical protein
MRLNYALGVPHHPGRISAPGARQRGLAVLLRPSRSKVRRKREHVSALPSLPLRADAEAGYAHHHGRPDNASGIGASIPKIYCSSWNQLVRRTQEWPGGWVGRRKIGARTPKVRAI